MRILFWALILLFAAGVIFYSVRGIVLPKPERRADPETSDSDSETLKKKDIAKDNAAANRERADDPSIKNDRSRSEREGDGEKRRARRTEADEDSTAHPQTSSEQRGKSESVEDREEGTEAEARAVSEGETGAKRSALLSRKLSEALEAEQHAQESGDTSGSAVSADHQPTPAPPGQDETVPMLGE